MSYNFNDTDSFSLDSKEDASHQYLVQKKYKFKKTMNWNKKKGNNIFSESSKDNDFPPEKYDETYFFSRKLILGDHRKNKGKQGKNYWSRKNYHTNRYIREVISTI